MWSLTSCNNGACQCWYGAFLLGTCGTLSGLIYVLRSTSLAAAATCPMDLGLTSVGIVDTFGFRNHLSLLLALGAVEQWRTPLTVPSAVARFTTVGSARPGIAGHTLSTNRGRIFLPALSRLRLGARPVHGGQSQTASNGSHCGGSATALAARP